MAKISEETRLHFSEAVQPYKNKISQTLEKEKTIIKNDYDFTLMWVKKESSIKALGCGMSIDLKTIDTLSYNGIIIDYSNYLIGIVLKEDV